MGLVARTNKRMEPATVFTDSAYAEPNPDATRKRGKAKILRDRHAAW